MKKHLFALALLASFGAHAAGTVDNTTINQVAIAPSTAVVVVYVSTAITGQPSCGTSRFAFDATTTNGKLVMQAVMQAYMSGSAVKIDGTGGCTVMTTGEDLYAIYIK